MKIVLNVIFIATETKNKIDFFFFFFLVVFFFFFFFFNAVVY